MIFYLINQTLYKRLPIPLAFYYFSLIIKYYNEPLPPSMRNKLSLNKVINLYPILLLTIFPLLDNYTCSIPL